VSALGLKVPDKGWNIVWVIDDEHEVHVVGFDNNRAYSDWIQRLSTRKAALDNRFTERITQE
jgi:hypothetical protein